MRVLISSPQGILYAGEASKVRATSVEGVFEVLEGHAPFIAQLIPGKVQLQTSEGERAFDIEGGYLWVSPDRDVQLLVR
ncbi:MAG: F0F1 ATP synthase subunit epsilon [Bacteroidia bacterium]|nr:F0F1 ATP synthase subunit epsilon [Bacteroidia bacterium]MDW8014450.1 F0F1 ATP synthase subunit epsilon [Bacteroidia bacterium]